MLFMIEFQSWMFHHNLQCQFLSTIVPIFPPTYSFILTLTDLYFFTSFHQSLDIFLFTVYIDRTICTSLDLLLHLVLIQSDHFSLSLSCGSFPDLAKLTSPSEASFLLWIGSAFYFYRLWVILILLLCFFISHIWIRSFCICLYPSNSFH